MRSVPPRYPDIAGEGDGDDAPPARFEHDAVIYGSTGELTAAVAPFVRDAVRVGEAVSVITTEANIGAVADAVGHAARRVSFVDSGDFYETPARTIASAHELREELFASGVSRVRFLGEVPFGSSVEERTDWLRYEAILNSVFAAVPQWCVCLYDQRRLPDWLIEGAYRTHPHLLSRGGHRARNPRFEDPASVIRELTPPPPRAHGEPALEMQVGIEGLGAARRAVADMARSASATEERAMELAMGLNEIMTNAIEHGSEQARVRCWQEAREVVCEVVDEGPGCDDPFVGYRPPDSRQEGGRGLWLARQTFDRVELEPTVDAGLRACLAAEL